MKISLRALRVNAEMTQETAAEKLGITSNTLRNWEDYKTFPDAAQLISMCTLYRCKISDIFLPDTLAKS